MKKITTIITIMILFITGSASLTPAQTSGPIKIESLTRQDYTVSNTVTGVSRSNRFWILFIPIGGKSETKRREQAYKRAIEKCDCDGILQPVYSEQKVPIPLIVFGYFHRKTTVSGKGYRIKADSLTGR